MWQPLTQAKARNSSTTDCRTNRLNYRFKEPNIGKSLEKDSWAFSKPGYSSTILRIMLFKESLCLRAIFLHFLLSLVRFGRKKYKLLLGEQIVFSKIEQKDFFSGISHCTNRPSQILLSTKLVMFSSKLTAPQQFSEFKTISQDFCALRPILSPDEQGLAFFSQPKTLTHANALSLQVYSFSTGKTDEIIPVYRDDPNDNLDFFGLNSYYPEILQMHWLSDSLHLVFSTLYRFAANIYLVNIKTKSVKKLNPFSLQMDRWSILTLSLPDNLLIAKLESISQFQDKLCFLAGSDFLASEPCKL